MICLSSYDNKLDASKDNALFRTPIMGNETVGVDFLWPPDESKANYY